jgi:hypothetical protein
MKVGAIDADVAQGMVIERRELRQQTPVRSASPPQGQQPDDFVGDPRFAGIRTRPAADVATRNVRPPKLPCHFSEMKLHKNTSFKVLRNFGRADEAWSAVHS